MAKLPEIFIGADDAAAIARLLDDRSPETAFAADAKYRLADKLIEARIVAPRALPPGIVRLNARVVYEELPGQRREVTIVNPRQADPASGRISVLSPVGRALLGNAVGAVVEIALPAGRSLFVRIVALKARQLATDRLEEKQEHA